MTDAMERVTGVDSHAHVLRRDAPLAPERHSAPSRDATVEEYLAVLDTHGISHAVLTAPSFYGTDNSLLLQALAASPQRLRGTVTVAPDTDPDTLARFAAAGVVGIRCNWVRREQLPDITTPAYGQLLQRLRELGWHMELYLEGRRSAPFVQHIRASGVRLVLDHFASPDPGKGVQCAGFQEALKGVRAGDTFVKLSGPYRLGGAPVQPYVDALLDAGAQQLVWASDWPFVSFENKVTYRETLDWLHAWVPDERTRQMILVETPARLFGWAHCGHDGQ